MTHVWWWISDVTGRPGVMRKMSIDAPSDEGVHSIDVRSEDGASLERERIKT